MRCMAPSYIGDIYMNGSNFLFVRTNPGGETACSQSSRHRTEGGRVMIRVREPWVIVLAGGSGERLRAVTTPATGESTPKQFCRLGGRTSMLGMTLARARRITATDRILVLVREEHRPWWQTEVGSAEQVLVQSRNRGTGLALLRALLH